MQFFMINMKMKRKRKRNKKIDLPRRGFEPRIFEQIPAQFLWRLDPSSSGFLELLDFMYMLLKVPTFVWFSTYYSSVFKFGKGKWTYRVPKFGPKNLSLSLDSKVENWSRIDKTIVWTVQNQVAVFQLQLGPSLRNEQILDDLILTETP